MESTTAENTSLLFDERLIWGVLIFVLSLFSCGSSSNSDTYSGITGTLEQMPILPATHEYAMWLDENDNTRLMTSFVPGDDKIFRLASAPQSQFIEDTEEIYVTIEEKNSGYIAPSIYEIVGARFTSNDESSVRTYPITSDVATASGSVSLEFEESTGNTFVKFLDANEESILNLPVLNNGWIYTLWYEADGEEREFFTSSDLGGGQFLAFGDLTGGVLKIGIESELLGSTTSLGMYILQHEIDDVSGVFEMTPTFDNLPTGVINKERE